MRIIAGSERGRRITAPSGQGTRPITDRAKEGIFNMLISAAGFDDAIIDWTVLDLFAGSGSFGLECLSRGAAHCTFVERDRNAVRTINDNIETLGFGARATVLPTTAEAALGSRTSPVDLIFCDPPYAAEPWDQLGPLLNSRFLVAHAETPPPVPAGWTELKRRAYGRPQILIAAPTDQTAAELTSAELESGQGGEALL